MRYATTWLTAVDISLSSRHEIVISVSGVRPNTDGPIEYIPEEGATIPIIAPRCGFESHWSNQWLTQNRVTHKFLGRSLQKDYRNITRPP
jgi:hypothetical protein